MIGAKGVSMSLMHLPCSTSHFKPCGQQCLPRFEKGDSLGLLRRRKRQKIFWLKKSRKLPSLQQEAFSKGQHPYWPSKSLQHVILSSQIDRSGQVILDSSRGVTG